MRNNACCSAKYHDSKRILTPTKLRTLFQVYAQFKWNAARYSEIILKNTCTNQCQKPSHVSAGRSWIFHNYLFLTFAWIQHRFWCIGNGIIKIELCCFQTCWIACLFAAMQYEHDEFMVVITRNVKGWPFIAFYCVRVNCEITIATTLNIKPWSTLSCYGDGWLAAWLTGSNGWLTGDDDIKYPILLCCFEVRLDCQLFGFIITTIHYEYMYKKFINWIYPTRPFNQHELFLFDAFPLRYNGFKIKRNPLRSQHRQWNTRTKKKKKRKKYSLGMVRLTNIHPALNLN